jgi:hypothetical protein
MNKFLTLTIFLTYSIQSTSQSLDSISFENYKHRFSDFFELMNEPKSIDYDTTLYINGTYRLTLLPSFRNPITITIIGQGRNVIAIGKFYTLAIPGDFKNLQSIKVDTVQVPWHNWLDFQKNKLDASLFWFLPENCISPKLDGTVWLIEGSSEIGSKKIYLHSPRENSSIYNVGLFLTSLFGYTEL